LFILKIYMNMDAFLIYLFIFLVEFFKHFLMDFFNGSMRSPKGTGAQVMFPVCKCIVAILLLNYRPSILAKRAEKKYTQIEYAAINVFLK